MTDIKQQAKAYYQANKEKFKEYYQANKEKYKEYYQAHKEQIKVYNQAHKEQRKTTMKAWKELNKEKYNAYKKAYSAKYYKSELNSLGKTKASIRSQSRRILKKMHVHLDGYEIHHCFGYDDPSKFIYCNREIHVKIHQFLRDNNIEADSDHYEQIKHLLDDSVIVYNL